MSTPTRIFKRKPSHRLYYRPRLLVLEDRTLPSFIAALGYDTGDNPHSVAVGDFNGDGILDLAVANSGDSQGGVQGVSVLLGVGDGTFQAARTFAAGRRPFSVAVGDFNGDGRLDLAVTSSGDSQGGQGVSVLLGLGDGTFLAPRTFAAGTSPTSVVVGDFNGDGIPDLAMANLGSANVSVLLGVGDGTFGAARNFNAGFNPYSLAVGDFNGDGIPDLAVANFTISGTVSVLLGVGDGSFQTARTFAAGHAPDSVAVGDFNGDGIPDLAVVNRDGVSVLLGVGDGTFGAARTFAAGASPFSVAVGDFNGDGIPDLAVTNYVSNTVSVLLGVGDGTFLAPRAFAAGIGPGSMVVGDFNRDGKLDLAVANGYPIYGVTVLLGNGDGTFGAARNFATGSNPRSVVVGDFNGDGIPDLAVANVNSNTVSVLLGVGDGTFGAAREFAIGFSPVSMVVGDFNGDGLPDLAVVNGGDIYGRGGSVSVLLGRGDSNFQAARNYAVGGNPYSMVVGDFNGDGITDLAVANISGVRVLLGNRDGSFQTTPISYQAGSSPFSVAVGDFNADGYPDLAVVNLFSNDGSILLNDRRWPAAPGGGSSPHAGPRGMLPPALAALLPPSPDPHRVPAAPQRDTAPALSPPVAAPDQRFLETLADGFARVAIPPLFARRPPPGPHVLDSDLSWAEWQEWIA